MHRTPRSAIIRNTHALGHAPEDLQCVTFTAFGFLSFETSLSRTKQTHKQTNKQTNKQPHHVGLSPKDEQLRRILMKLCPLVHIWTLLLVRIDYTAGSCGRGIVHRSSDCRKCLHTANVTAFDQFHPSPQTYSSMDVAYLAVAKGGSRTIRDALCGWSNPEGKEIRDKEKRPHHKCLTLQQHCHRCRVKDLEEYGAEHILVPLRPPADRIHSLMTWLTVSDGNTKKKGHHVEDGNAPKRMNDCFGGSDAAAVDRFMTALRDTKHYQHEAALWMLPAAWKTLEYYLGRATGKAKIKFVCKCRLFVIWFLYGSAVHRVQASWPI
jgi:hypothetical protein